MSCSVRYEFSDIILINFDENLLQGRNADKKSEVLGKLAK